MTILSWKLSPHLEGVDGHIVFGLDPFGVSVGVAFCLRQNLWTVGWILTKLGQLEGMIRFPWPWSNFQGHQCHITMKKPCLHSIFWTNCLFWTNCQIYTYLAQLHHWEDLNRWLYFCDLDLVCKVIREVGRGTHMLSSENSI